MSVGGPLDSISLAGREFAVAGDADTQRKLGGLEADVVSNGNGTARIILTVVPSNLEGIVVDVDDDKNDQQYMQDLVDAKKFFDCDFTYANGSVYQGSVMLTGELKFSNQSTTATINLKGTGKFTKQ